MTSANDLTKRRCEPCEGGVPALESDAVSELVKALDPDWRVGDNGTSISRLFEFAGYQVSAAEDGRAGARLGRHGN